MKVDVGGFEVAAGLRLRFGAVRSRLLTIDLHLAPKSAAPARRHDDAERPGSGGGGAHRGRARLPPS